MAIALTMGPAREHSFADGILKMVLCVSSSITAKATALRLAFQLVQAWVLAVAAGHLQAVVHLSRILIEAWVAYTITTNTTPMVKVRPLLRRCDPQESFAFAVRASRHASGLSPRPPFVSQSLV